MATIDPKNTAQDAIEPAAKRHRALSLSEPPSDAADDDDDDAGDEVVAPPRRARRRPRPEHISTPPRMAVDDAGDDDDDSDDDDGALARAPRKKSPQRKAAAAKGKKKVAKRDAAPARESLPLEVTGVVVFALDVLLALSLVSYSPGDGRPGRAAENLIGPGGAFVADVLTITFGAIAFVIPVMLLAVVLACFRPIARPRHALLRVGAALSASVALMTLAHLILRGTEALPFPAGGLVGALVADAGSRILAPLGTGVVAVAVAFVGVVIALDRPVGGTTRSILDRLVDAWHAATESIEVWREERRLLAEVGESAHSGNDSTVDDAAAVAAAEAEAERLRQRDEKLAARRLRIADRAQARVDEARAAGAQADGDCPLEHDEAPMTATKASLPPQVVIPIGGRTAKNQRLAQQQHDDAVAASGDVDGGIADVAGGLGVDNDDASIEAQTIVQSDPPWAQDIDDGTVVSLAEAMERVKKSRATGVAPGLRTAALDNDELVKLVDDELKIIERHEDPATLVAEAERLDREAHTTPKREFVLPPLNLLDYDAPEVEAIDEGKLRTQADKLTAKFLDFGIEGRVREIRPGPVVTTYEFVPAPGIKVSKIAALSDDIAMAMEAVHVRIVAPIPGKGAVGIELPNEKRETVFMKEIIADPQFKKREEKLMMALGKDIEGKSYYANLADMPHVLISGTTGSGKSVSVNAMICSILYRSTPEDVRFMMIDPKMLELSLYEGIPHLLLPPIIDSKKAAVALKWAVAEMERRYQLLSDQGVRDIKGFNDKLADANANIDDAVRTGLFDKDGKRLTKMPFIVVIIDEYADLIAVAGKEVESHVMRLAQKARAAGIHVMLATQRPSVDVITGVIKANFPVRMGFRLASNHDSKTIINQPGAEKLLGRGDMLFMPPGTSNVLRVHGAFISEKELHRVVDHLKTQGAPDYNMDILTYQEEGDEGGGSSEDVMNEPKDARYDEALTLVGRTKKCSTSFVQRMLNIGYQRAARIVDRMEREGLVGPALNTKGDREIFLRADGSVDASQRINM